MTINLVVTSVFDKYQIGDTISEPELVSKFSESHPSFVVKVVAADPPRSIPEVSVAKPIAE